MMIGQTSSLPTGPPLSNLVNYVRALSSILAGSVQEHRVCQRRHAKIFRAEGQLLWRKPRPFGCVFR